MTARLVSGLVLAVLAAGCVAPVPESTLDAASVDPAAEVAERVVTHWMNGTIVYGVGVPPNPSPLAPSAGRSEGVSIRDVWVAKNVTRLAVTLAVDTAPPAGHVGLVLVHTLTGDRHELREADETSTRHLVLEDPPSGKWNARIVPTGVVAFTDYVVNLTLTGTADAE